MELRTDTEKLNFLLEAEAELADFLADGELSAQAADRPKYITNYIGSTQKLGDWIWANTPDGQKLLTNRALTLIGREGMNGSRLGAPRG
ncbi:MAG: hypothetical protein ABIH03_06935 [Pseudomonadota bacterium]